MRSNRVFFSVLALLVFAHLQAMAQTEPAPTANPDGERSDREWKTARLSAAFYPFAMVGSHFKLGLTYSIGDVMALHALGSYMYTQDRNDFYDYFDIANSNDGYYSGFNTELHLRYYALGRPQNGLYLGPYAWYRGVTGHGEIRVYNPQGGYVTTGSSKETMNALGVGIITGYQVLVGRVVFDVYMGGGPNFPSGATAVSSGNNFLFSFRRGMAYNGGLSIGVVLGN